MKFISRKETRELLETAVGYTRNQKTHPLCWAYATGDLVSASRYLHGWVEAYVPSCAHFLCSKMDTEDYGANVPENGDLQSNKVDSCYPSSLTLGLFFSQNCGIPIEREATFNCNIKRVLDPAERLYKIDEFFRYKTLEQALVRLRSHPVGSVIR